MLNRLLSHTLTIRVKTLLVGGGWGLTMLVAGFAAGKHASPAPQVAVASSPDLGHGVMRVASTPHFAPQRQASAQPDEQVFGRPYRESHPNQAPSEESPDGVSTYRLPSTRGQGETIIVIVRDTHS